MTEAMCCGVTISGVAHNANPGGESTSLAILRKIRHIQHYGLVFLGTLVGF